MRKTRQKAEVRSTTEALKISRCEHRKTKPDNKLAEKMISHFLTKPRIWIPLRQNLDPVSFRGTWKRKPGIESFLKSGLKQALRVRHLSLKLKMKLKKTFFYIQVPT